MRDLWYEANLFLYNMNVGDYYLVGNKRVECIERKNNKIKLSNGIVVRLQKLKDTNSFYLASNKKVKKGTRTYDYVNQILRDVEGYLLYKIHAIGV